MIPDYIVKSELDYDDIKNYNRTEVIAQSIMEDGNTKALFFNSIVETTSIMTYINVGIQKPDGSKQLLFTNYSIFKSIKFYNELKETPKTK